MSSTDQIAHYKKLYSKKTRSDLISITHKYATDSYPHIAAKQLLDEMNRAESAEAKKEEERRHRELVEATVSVLGKQKEEKSTEKPTKHWHEKAIGKIVIGVTCGVIVLFIGFYVKYMYPEIFR